MKSFLAPFGDVTYAAMRIAAAVLFTFHGLQKIFGVLADSTQPVGSLLWVAGVIETLAGVMIAIGLLTPYAAFLASGEMAAAYFRSHASRGPWPIRNGGELAILFCFVFLYVASRGGGRFSVDAIRGR